MENTVNALLDKIAEHVKEMTRTETIIGEEFTIGEYKCKPVIKIGVGFASGSGTGDSPKGKGQGTGIGGGAGVGVSPVGFIVTKGEEISFIPADNKKGLSGIIDKIPDIIEKVMDVKQAKEEKSYSGKKEK